MERFTKSVYCGKQVSRLFDSAAHPCVEFPFKMNPIANFIQGIVDGIDLFAG
jgi:hypothetical protein